VQRQHFSPHPNSRNDAKIVVARTGTIRPKFRCFGHHMRRCGNNTMTSKQLVRQREAVKAQLRRAALHGGDEELLNLLRVESYRLLMNIEAISRSPGWPPTRLVTSCSQARGEEQDDHPRISEHNPDPELQVGHERRAHLFATSSKGVLTNGQCSWTDRTIDDRSHH